MLDWRPHLPCCVQAALCNPAPREKRMRVGLLRLRSIEPTSAPDPHRTPMTPLKGDIDCRDALLRIQGPPMGEQSV
ncbi:hypothetical protein NDU88_002150 [Pleurodeles waltl]|uniref:Uncharacterized protein n=1 Tax=Pleurodeles waltl TaxID=8319 RepID=A0AAV7WPG8_PLEWA|nr:hypothetical protein NDU88_002150 [Pleurodeles waltl]